MISLFESNVIGGHNDILEIITNLNENNASSFEVDLTAQKDSSSIFLEKSTLEYSELDENESKTLNVKVHNTGTIDIEWNLPLETSNFEVTSINPITTKAGDSSIFEIKFKGGIEDQSPYNEKITLTDICGKKYNLNLIATIGSNDAKIENIDDLVLPTIVCEETNEFSFDIKNIGTTPLVISEIGFDIKDNNFAFKNDYTGLIIKSGETEKLKITYNAETAGKYSNIINLKTNAVNVNNGEVSIEIRFSKEIVLLGTSVNSIEIDGLIQDQEKQVEIQITNNGTKDIEFLSFSSLNRFNLINPPSDIKVGETKDLLVKFTGGNLGITYNEELYIYDDCSNAKRITLSASVNKIPNAKLEISSASAYPGQTFLLPIKLILEEDIDISEDVSASFILNFNKSIMMPLTQHISSIDSSRKNIMIENILLKDLMEGTNLEFKAYLGDTNYTDIKVSNINIENSDELLISGKDGDFTLLGVCRDGGNRFIIDTGELQLFQNYPNPVYTSSRISFFAIETGNHRVDIYDTYGTKLREVFNKNVSPGLYEVSFDANDLPSGSYIYILQTPSVTIKRKLQVLR